MSNPTNHMRIRKMDELPLEKQVLLLRSNVEFLTEELRKTMIKVDDLEEKHKSLAETVIYNGNKLLKAFLWQGQQGGET